MKSVRTKGGLSWYPVILRRLPSEGATCRGHSRNTPRDRRRPAAIHARDTTRLSPARALRTASIALAVSVADALAELAGRVDPHRRHDVRRDRLLCVVLETGWRWAGSRWSRWSTIRCVPLDAGACLAFAPWEIKLRPASWHWKCCLVENQRGWVHGWGW
jgi:hypothetical protein